MKKTFFFYLLLCSLCGTVAQANIYFKHLGKSDGLSQISVMSISQDELGRMWFGTFEGLNCWDGTTMTVYSPSEEPDGVFTGGGVFDLVCDKRGSVFFISSNRLVRYDLQNERFIKELSHASCIHSGKNEVWAASRDSLFRWDISRKKFLFSYRMPQGQSITCIGTDASNRLWIGTQTGLFCSSNLQKISPVCVIPHANICSLYGDNRNRMWAAAFRKGMYVVENAADNQSFTVRSDIKLSSDDVRCFVEDEEGCIWAGTFDGLNKIDLQGNVARYAKDTKPGSLTHSSIFSLYKDRQGTIWIGTYYGGVNYFNPQTDIFRHYASDKRRNDCLSFAYVGNMVEDKRGDLWICTEGGGLNRLDRKSGLFSYYLDGHIPAGEVFSNLKCIEYDKNQDCLYIGTHKQGYLRFDIPANKVTHYPELHNQSINEIMLKGDTLFLLSPDKGLYISLKDGKGLQRLFRSERDTHWGGITMLVDSRNDLWVSQFSRVLRINLDHPERKAIYNYGENGLGMFQVTKMAEGNDGAVYLATYGSGLYRFNEAGGCFDRCPIGSIRYCYNLLNTPKGYLVLSNEQGLLLYHPQTGEKRFIDMERQLHLSALNEGCGILRCRDGEMFVGGADGMSSFSLLKFQRSQSDYRLYFSSLAVNEQQVSVHTSDGILPVAFPFVKEIRLAYNKNNILITFASDNYVSKHLYEYRLGEEQWNAAVDNRIKYTNLPPGNHELQVRERAEGTPGKTLLPITLNIIVERAWWTTWWAWSIYVLLVSAVVWLILRNWQTKLRLRASLVQEKMEKEKNKELVESKLQFFANISHEFRTPLTLMISQIEALLQTPALSPYIRTRLQKIYKSTYQFRELISELLDFRKMERGKQTLHLHTSDMVPFLKQIHEEFVSQARLQEIEFVLAVPEGSLLCQCDDRQLRKVFTNLLSNAFKHTPKGGKVELVLEELADAVKVKVIDNGEGIPQEALPYIFDRFYQVDSLSSAPAGSGIGLALAKGIIDLHHGTIDVQSALGYGSIFTVTLPKGHPDEAEMQAEAVAAEGVSPYPSVEPDADAGGQAVEAGTSGEKMCVLIVEDNEELLQMLISLLSPLYRVVIAMNGKEGLARAKDEHPDLILSDVMMPIMSGTEMCTLLKNDFDLCHIPIILLTALGADNNKLEGWQCGADDYIEKPFSNRLLLGRIANILRNRKLLQQKFGKGMTTDSADDVDIQALAFSPIDTQFLTKLKEVVENHLSDPDFDVNVLAQELAVSRSSLYNKLKALSSMTPNELILNARLKRAVEMLKTNPQMQITEIAFQNGFSSLRYFRHCFKTHFNCTPQEYRDGKKEEEQH